MKFGPLGRSGLIVSRICLGGNSWGAKGRRGWGKFDEAEAPAYFKRALDVGITFFDTADTSPASLGRGTSPPNPRPRRRSGSGRSCCGYI